MINPKELQIGNIIYCKTNSMSVVVRYPHPAKIVVDVRHPDGGGCDFVDGDLEEFEPVPLTPEWLERCGFQFLDSVINGRYYVRWANSPSEIAWYPVGEYISVNTSTGGEGEQPNYTELQMSHIKCLHQLQNLYFVLTGEELTINIQPMSWWNKKKGVDQDNWIEVGDCVTYREAFPNLDKYFIHGPLEVIRIDDGPEYAGGKFIICKYGYGETGFYLNAVKKVK